MFTSHPGWLISQITRRFRLSMQYLSTCFMFAPEYIPSFGRGTQMTLRHSILIAFKCMTVCIFNTSCFKHASSNLSTSWPKTGIIGASTRVCGMDHLKEEDQSFSDLMEVCSSHFKRQRPNEEEPSSGQQRFRSGQRRSSHSSASGSVDDSTLLGMLARLTLRQEDQLNQLNLDRTFLLFIQAGKSSILPQMLQISKTWHGQREQGKVDRPLRQLMFQSVFEELASRAAQLPLGSNDHELILALRSKQILTTTNAWNYLQWDHQDKTLKPSSRDPISSEEASKMIERIHTLANQPELIHRFTALKPMPSDQVGPTSNVVIPWRLDISLRSSASQELFDLLTKLTGNGLTQLIAVRLRPSTLQRSPLAQAVARTLKR